MAVDQGMVHTRRGRYISYRDGRRAPRGKERRGGVEHRGHDLVAPVRALLLLGDSSRGCSSWHFSRCVFFPLPLSMRALPRLRLHSHRFSRVDYVPGPSLDKV